MKIVVLGKTGCGKCEACKAKLGLMSLPFEYVALDSPNGWREQGAVDALAAAAMAGLDFRHPPIVVIGEQAYTYSAGMKELKTNRLMGSR
jgi:glutaredoxin